MAVRSSGLEFAPLPVLQLVWQMLLVLARLGQRLKSHEQFLKGGWVGGVRGGLCLSQQQRW